MKKNRKLLDALKDARENGVSHMAFVAIEQGHAISMNCTSDEIYDCLYSLCMQKEDFLEILCTIVEDILSMPEEPEDEQDILAN